MTFVLLLKKNKEEKWLPLKLQLGKGQVAQTNFKQGLIGLDSLMLSLFPPIFRFAISVADPPGRLPVPYNGNK